MMNFPLGNPGTDREQTALRLLCSAIESLDQAVVVANPDGIIAHVNSAFTRLTGIPPGNPGGPPTVDGLFAGPNRPPLCRELCRNSADNWTGETRLPGAGGTEVPVHVRINLARGRDSAPIGFSLILTDLTARKRVDERLRMFELAVVHCLEPVLITEAEPIDLPGPRIVYVNRAFTKVTGYTSEEVLGKSPRILQGPKSQRSELDRIRRALTRWKPVKAELLNYRKDGTEFWVELAIFPVADETGWYTHWVSVQRDITDKKQIEEHLRIAKEDAERANLAKSSFLANMSHEIRTPLTAILGYSDILLDRSTGTVEHDESARSIRRNGQHLLEIVGNILDLSKIEAGKFVLDLIPYSPWHLALEVCSSQRVIASAKQVKLRIRAVSPLPVECLIDPTSVRQVLLNLVCNAIKFTETGGNVVLSVEASRVPGTASGVELKFVVDDDGVGIDEPNLGRLFEAFEQGDNSTSRKHGGTGLGLNISQRLARLMGGALTAHSIAGQGSTFDFRLPCQFVGDARTWVQPDDSEAVTTVPASSSEPLSRPDVPKLAGRLLLVDDSEDNRLILHYYLHPTGLEIEMAQNGREAVIRARARPYDLILLDMQMPEVDGYAAAHELRQAGYQQPIIALTAHAMPEDRVRCLRAGCTDYLAKPVTVANLYAMLTRYVQPVSQIESATIPLQSTLNLDDPGLADLARSFIGRLDERLDSLTAAFAANDLPKCGSIAHSTKGAAGMYGFRPLSEVSAQIEQAVRRQDDPATLPPLIQEFGDLVRRIQAGAR